VSEGDGLPLGEGDMLAVRRLSGAKVSLGPQPLKRVTASKNEKVAIGDYRLRRRRRSFVKIGMEDW
jgi:hypothetical protein